MTTVATGAASGSGAATARLLTARPETVIRVDLAGAYVNPSLTITEGRCAMIEDVARLADESVRAVVANAGGAAPLTVSVKCFDAVATLEGIRPLKAKSPPPRVVMASAMASFHPYDDNLIAAMPDRDECPTAF